MERRIVVMRHAKSDWDTNAKNDHERPLNKRGRQSAPMVANHLSTLGWQPQHILSSDARRTRETAELLLESWEDGIGVDFTSKLYLAGPSELQFELCVVSDEVETLLVLGHNPGWEGVVYRLTDVGVTMKTATAAMLHSDACESWSDAFDADWTLHEIINPREIA